jgi:hypothetical protein
MKEEKMIFGGTLDYEDIKHISGGRVCRYVALK